MNQDKARKVLSALESQRIMAQDKYGNYTRREITPKWITEAIDIMREEAAPQAPAEPISDAELEKMWSAAMYKSYREEEGEAYQFFARALLERK